MSIEIEVMYSDFSRQRVPLEQVQNLRNDGVLFIIASANDTIRPRLNGRRRTQEKFGKDWYYLRNEAGLLEIGGWDLQDYKQIRIDDPWGSKLYASQPLWLSGGSVVFEGGHIPDEKWSEALRVFYAEMH